MFREYTTNNTADMPTPEGGSQQLNKHKDEDKKTVDNPYCIPNIKSTNEWCPNVDLLSRDVSRYMIVNDFDRPDVQHVAYLSEDNVIRYLNFELRKSFPYLSAGRGCQTLADFGFVFDGNLLKQLNKNTAKYPDGESRSWQGISKFTLNDAINDKRN